MDPLEQQIRDAFALIPFGDSGQNLLESDKVFSLEVIGNRAEVLLVIDHEHESFTNGLTQGIEAALKGCDGIDEVGINVVATFEEAQKTLAAHEHHHHGHEHGHAHPHAHDHAHAHPHAPAPQKRSYLGEYGQVVLVASGKGALAEKIVETAREAGVHNCKEIQVQTANGSTTGCIALVPQMTLGNFTLNNITVAVMPNMETNLLGANVLRNFRVGQDEDTLLIGRN